MKHVVHHDLDQALARKAADKAWESYSERFAKYNPRATWTSDKHADIEFHVKSVTLRGAIDLEPKGIAMELDVPFLFRPFKKVAIEVIETEIRKWVDRAKKGEL